MDCILCGKCLEVCPLLRATGREELGPRAKADLCGILESSETLAEVDVARLANFCLGCGRCREKCSKGVDVPARVAQLRSAHPDFRSWLWKTWLTHSRELWPSAKLAASMIPKRFSPEKLGPMLKAMSGLKKGLGIEPFIKPESLPQTLEGQTVALFAGCTASHVAPRWAAQTTALLQGLGAEVIRPKFGCCASPMRSAGLFPEAEKAEEKNLRAWRKAGRPKVVTLCTSCQHGLKAYAGHFEDVAEATQWSDALTPLSSLLLEGAFVVTDFVPDSVAYHRPCHVDKTDSDYIFLADVLGQTLLPVTEGACCGFGGIMQLAAPELTNKVNAERWASLQGTSLVLTGCSACAARLAATAPEGVFAGHWLDAIMMF